MLHAAIVNEGVNGQGEFFIYVVLVAILFDARPSVVTVKSVHVLDFLLKLTVMERYFIRSVIDFSFYIEIAVVFCDSQCRLEFLING